MTHPSPNDAARPDFDADGPLVIVLNAGSGRADADTAQQTITGVLAAAGRAHEVLRIERGMAVAEVAGEAVRRARAQRGAVVAAGGDGTLNAVAQAVLPAGLPFGVLPQGTFNYFSRTHGITSDTEQATQALLRARPAPVQVGLVNERLFLVNASVGLYPQLLEDREAYKQRFGRRRWVAAWSALVTLLHAHRPLRLQIECQGEQRAVRTSTLFVGNNGLQLQQIGVPEADLLAQGHLVALMLKPVSTFGMLGLMLRGAFGRLGEADDVLRFGFERLGMRPAAPRRTARVKVATDGEIIWLRAPLTFRVSPQPLWLLTPAPEDRVEPA
ncbi:diacylglycerol kinase family protein [Pseudorhodoferax sp. Leaf274]|uniref:diacylglycerol/lipid kinase family protein n=1 Tax=Pseudorhodoferax sp. Leaf274 TaxID=1736318 RepID=UPI000703A9D5|nr:diacylglycerol kinase family protein [Pseudorhodoferax sp. Leaf274]KQP48612.1 diacylglycerol kinase [Pseudorhodoferax sp. Leaf274]